MKTCRYLIISLVLTVTTACQLSAEAILSVQAQQVFTNQDQLQVIRALAQGNFKEADAILEKLDVNASGPNGETLLWWEANIGNIEAFEYLLKKGASPIRQVLNSANTLELAAACPDTRFLRAAIAYGANVNMISQFEHGTPLLMAVQHRNKANVELLIKAGACVNIADTMGTTPLVWSLDMKAFDIAVMLLKNGASPAYKNVQGHDARTSLREARVNASDPEYKLFAQAKRLIENEPTSQP